MYIGDRQILTKELEHLQILVSVVVLEPAFHRYQGRSVYKSTRKAKIPASRYRYRYTWLCHVYNFKVWMFT
jgi:hypothetical protein